jgi:hypothetical protein
MLQLPIQDNGSEQSCLAFVSKLFAQSQSLAVFPKAVVSQTLFWAKASGQFLGGIKFKQLPAPGHCKVTAVEQILIKSTEVQPPEAAFWAKVS